MAGLLVASGMAGTWGEGEYGLRTLCARLTSKHNGEHRFVSAVRASLRCHIGLVIVSKIQERHAPCFLGWETPRL